MRPGLGEDAAVFDPGRALVVVSSDPITGAGTSIGWYAVHVATNDVAAGGGRPLGVLITMMVPPDGEEDIVEGLQQDVARAAAGLGIEVLGGHTEVTDAVTRPVVVATAVGLATGGRLLDSSGGRPGDQLVVTKEAGLEGTAILATDHAARAAEVLSPLEITAAAAFIERLSVVPEALLAAEHGSSAMHDVTEGGVLGATWELARASGTGFCIDRRLVPVAAQTRKLCKHFGIDPLRLISSGSLLVATPRGGELVRSLQAAGIGGAVVGELTPGGYRVIGDDGEEHLPETWCPDDELFRLLDRWAGG